ncbi:IS630 family transposase [Acaryochloris marina NIES-2412]|uniref:IS630 family transposase n=1 Tax=Acaryochloris marina TaxID=155978 RepID=UPI004058B9A9
MNRTQAFRDKPFDVDEWQKFYNRNQQQYIRQRLTAIKLLHEGQSRAQASKQVGCRYDTLTCWIDKFLDGGLRGLVQPIRHRKPSRLTPEQQQQLKEMVLTQHPTDYGIDRNMWTGAILSVVIEQRFEVQLKDSRIYELLSELGLSYQRAHRDYANADPQAQQEWVAAVKKLQSRQPGERIVFFDEFAVSERPNLFYGWAERNTRPEVPSNERARKKLNGFLCVDAHSGAEYFGISPYSKTEDVSEYFADLCSECVESGYTQLCIILDNNPTHKLKMQSQLAVHLEQMELAQSIQVEFLYLPSYSPKLNLVEYVIHLLRLRLLHHLPIGTTLPQIRQQLSQFINSNQFLSAAQVQKTLNHIFSVVP